MIIIIIIIIILRISVHVLQLSLLLMMMQCVNKQVRLLNWSELNFNASLHNALYIMHERWSNYVAKIIVVFVITIIVIIVIIDIFY